MKRFIAKMLALLAMGVFTTAAFAAGSFTGKVTAIEEEKITIMLEGTAPAWVKKGGTVSAMGGSPKVLSVNGKEVTLKFNKAKAAKVKADSTMTVTEADEEMQGC